MSKHAWAALCTCAALSGAVSTALADGNETIGTPSIAIAPGTGLVVDGVGLVTQPDMFDFTVPAGVAIEQVLLYWQGRGTADDTIELEGNAITGVQIGVSDPIPSASTAFRADITALGLVSAGANTLAVSGADFGERSDGAAIVVIVDDGSGGSEVQLRDGLDFAYINRTGAAQVTVPQTFSFDALAIDRTANVLVMMGDGTPDRPDEFELTVAGNTTVLCNEAIGRDGPEWDVIELPINVPAGATAVTVELFSRACAGGEPDATPDSISWVVGGLVLPLPECEFDSDCDDADACTDDVCDPVTSTCSNPLADDCDDDNACTTDSCDPAVGCVNTPIDPADCDDSNPCTNDSCDPASGCVNEPIDPADCDDDNACTTDSCDPASGGCINEPIDPADCDDDNACTTDSCDPASGCVNEPIDPATCDDDNICTEDICDPASGGCVNTTIAGCCIDAGDCDDSNPCTTDTCDPVTGECTNEPIPGGGDPVTVFYEDWEGYTSFPAEIPANDPVNPGLTLIEEGANELWFGGRFEQPDGGSIDVDLAVQKFGGGSNSSKTGRFEDETALMFKVSTAGLANATLSFDWRTFSAGSGDRFVAGYYVGEIDFGGSRFKDFTNTAPQWDSAWTEVLRSIGNSWSHKSVELPAGEPCIWVAFWLDGGEGDYGKVDNVEVSGTTTGSACCTSNDDCNDGAVCTMDVCDLTTGACSNSPIAGCCVIDEDCDDGDECTVDTCDTATGACSSSPGGSGGDTVLFWEGWEGYSSFPDHIPAGDPVNKGLTLPSEGADETWYGGRFEQQDGGGINGDLAVQKFGGGSNSSHTGRFEDEAGLMFKVSTAGFDSATLSFDWRTFSAGSGDRFVAGYYVGEIDFGTSKFRNFNTNGPHWDSSWTEVLRGINNNWSSKTVTLPGNEPCIWVAFWLDGGEGDYGKLDNVDVVGHGCPGGDPGPEPDPNCGPDAGDCHAENWTPGCSDGECCTDVCACDPFCCENYWDDNCAGPNYYVPGCSALELCN